MRSVQTTRLYITSRLHAEQIQKVDGHLCGDRAVGKIRMERASVYMDPAMDLGFAMPLICLACALPAPIPLSVGAAGNRGSCAILSPLYWTKLLILP